MLVLTMNGNLVEMSNGNMAVLATEVTVNGETVYSGPAPTVAASALGVAADMVDYGGRRRRASQVRVQVIAGVPRAVVHHSKKWIGRFVTGAVLA